MKTDNVLIIHPDTTEKLEALKSIVEAFKVRFEVMPDTKEYDPVFVEKIKISQQEIKSGKSVRIEKEELKSFLGL